MSLATLLSGGFARKVRERGHNYYRAGLVRITSGSERRVEATVEDSEPWAVQLVWEDRELEMFCDCPSYDRENCKHLWATILAAEARGYLSAATAPAPAPPPRWRKQIEAIQGNGAPPQAPWPERRQLLYVIDATASARDGTLVLELFTRERSKNGKSWNVLKELRWQRRDIARLPEAVDREVLSLLAGGKASEYYTTTDWDQLPRGYRAPHLLAVRILPPICAAGRCFLRTGISRADLLEVAWDAGECWQFRLDLARTKRGRWAVAGLFHRGEERMEAAHPALVTSGGLVVADGKAALLDEAAPFPWIAQLRGKDPIEAAEGEGNELLAALLEHPAAPPLAVPDELRYEDTALPLRPCLRIRAADQNYWNKERLRAELSFDYEGRRVTAEHASRGFFDPEQRRFLRRDLAAEAAAVSRLTALGLKFLVGSYWEPGGWTLAAVKLPGVVRALVGEGWQVEAEGKTFRRPGAFRLEVTSGVDWFELHGEADYGEASAQLPALLEALRKGETMVRLDDGTYGVLPEEWLARFGALAGMGALQTDHVRFRRSQAGLLDALLAAQPEARCDEGFARARRELREFAGVAAAAQPDGFAGQLRDYQREGLGWMQFLRRFGFGGCLADDMGLGKTAQALALLEARRQLRSNGGEDAPAAPSLAVVPKSLVFNWMQEAARFTPRLKVLDHTGLARSIERFPDYDLVLTTYGTLRRDVVLFQDFEFDCVVLDEAQAIKNADTESAKAVRLLRGRHRLALSGTPIENHLGELWSLFEFLNPGLLGAASVFKLAGGALRNPDAETRALLACALRPFILRRTKEQVARELPEKTEQTIYCEMEPQQRQLYDELRSHYRNVLLGRIDEQGLAKSKMHVLEALLRLRQAACHPGLLDPKRVVEPSAKLDVLLHRLEDVLEEGHKALVFSQFTSLLRIVRARLEERGVVYEYLDGQTRDRQQRVERFQDDPACPLFLVSLKAGGLGLNLTAAEYVFLLDPWWNPAVEAQAIDRTHRIGQTRQVFAYRLIARDTVEEKVLELQRSKRDLAAAIIGEDNSLIRDLRREDLELLLS